MKPEYEDDPGATSQSEHPPVEVVASAETDVDFVDRARRGDRAATEILVERHQAAVARLLWRFVRTRADLDDLVQDTFLRMLRGLPAWRAEQPFSHWLLRIATNVGRDYFRRHTMRRRWLAEPLPNDPDGSPQNEVIDAGGDPASRAAANEVKEMLAHLPADERAILTLHHLEGWSFEHISQQFGCTVTAVKLRAWRARRLLRNQLKSRDFL